MMRQIQGNRNMDRNQKRFEMAKAVLPVVYQQALGIINDIDSKNHPPENWREDFARHAWEMADAMLDTEYAKGEDKSE